MLNRDAVAEICASLPGAWPDSPWGPDDLVYKLGNRNADGGGKGAGKIFCFVGGGTTDGQPHAISLKADPAIVPALHEQYEAVHSPRYLNKSHWIAVTLESDLPDDELEDLIIDSYQRILSSFSKRQQRLITSAAQA